MDHYTITRLYHVALQHYERRDYKVDATPFMSVISIMLSEAFKKIDSNKCILLSDKGLLCIVDSMNSPLPPLLQNKRVMKSNSRSAIKDIIKTLLVLLGHLQIVNDCISIKQAIILLQFILSFQLENDELVSSHSFSEFFKYTRKQFLNTPSFLTTPEDVEEWKQIRTELVSSFYQKDISIQRLQEQIVTHRMQVQSLLRDVSEKQQQSTINIQHVQSQITEHIQSHIDSRLQDNEALHIELTQQQNKLDHLQDILDHNQRELISLHESFSSMVLQLKPVEDKPAEEKPSEEKPSEDKPAEEKPSEEKPVEEKAVEEKPSEEKPIEEKAVEEKPAEEKPVEEKAVEDKPAEDKPAEEKPVEDKPAEEKPAEEKPAEDNPAEEKPTEENPAEEKPEVLESTCSVVSGTDEIMEEIEAPSIIEPVAVVQAHQDEDDGDIQISKHGNYYTIRGTSVVIDVKTCNAIGYLEKDVFIRECNEYVKAICTQYDIAYV
jgi:hypothetical protein